MIRQMQRQIAGRILELEAELDRLRRLQEQADRSFGRYRP